MRVSYIHLFHLTITTTHNNNRKWLDTARRAFYLVITVNALLYYKFIINRVIQNIIYKKNTKFSLK